MGTNDLIERGGHAVNMEALISELANPGPAPDEQAVRDFTEACRRVDEDPREKRRYRDIADLIEAEDALYDQGVAALGRGDHDTARSRLTPRPPPSTRQDQGMNDADDCRQWGELEAQARVEAEEHRLSAEGCEQIRRALARARSRLGGEDVRMHNVPFHPDMWGLDATALPQRALDSGRISRGDGFAVAARPAEADANWQLFCTSFVFGYGTYGVGPARLKRILARTQPADLCAVIAEARRRLKKCGPLSAYDYLRGDDEGGEVPYWGPAFFTKLLYSADAPGETGRALILDNQTAWIVNQISGMEHLVDERNRSERWTAYRYGVYLAWMTMVSEQFQVRPDFLEYALFLEARRRRR
jgi:hypothetical protein